MRPIALSDMLLVSTCPNFVTDSLLWLLKFPLANCKHQTIKCQLTAFKRLSLKFVHVSLSYLAENDNSLSLPHGLIQIFMNVRLMYRLNF